MQKSKILAAALIAILALSPVASLAGPGVAIPLTKSHFNPGAAYVIFGCASSIIFAAFIANYQQNRQLTWNEAATCGILYWFTPPKRR